MKKYIVYLDRDYFIEVWADLVWGGGGTITFYQCHKVDGKIVRQESIAEFYTNNIVGWKKELEELEDA